MARSRLGFTARAGSSGVSITLSSNQTNYSLFTAASSPVVATVVTLTINSGIVVYSTSTGTPALDLSGFPSGSTITVINNGSIIGKGGAGGNGTNVSGTNNAGAAGGNAIKLGTNNVTIDNTSGSIFAGGGGGGSAGSAGASFAGGGGGGGQSYDASAGGSSGGGGASAGSSGTNSSAGAGGLSDPNNGVKRGGSGGGYGAAGSTGEISFGGNAGGSGGAAGKAVDLNGKSITWLGGNNGTQLKGAVS